MKPSKITAISNELRNELKKGLYPAGSRFPSEYDLAERFKINKTTANKAVGLLVKEGFLERGISGAGTTVKTNKIFPVGQLVYLTSILDDFYARLLHGAQQSAYERGYLVSYLMVKAPELEYAIAQLARSKIQGILTSCYGTVNATVPFPIMHIDWKTNNINYNSVVSDYYQGGKLIGKLLLKHGHRNIIYFSSDLIAQNMAKLRPEGTFDALTEAGIANPEERFFRGESTEFSCRSRLRQAMKRFPNFTAIVCDTDYEAHCAFKSLKLEGLNPEKISIAGYGNVKRIQDIFPLTTIDQHPVEMGKRGAETLIDMIEKNIPQPLEITTDVELIDRGTVRPVR